MKQRALTKKSEYVLQEYNFTTFCRAYTLKNWRFGTSSDLHDSGLDVRFEIEITTIAYKSDKRHRSKCKTTLFYSDLHAEYCCPVSSYK